MPDIPINLEESLHDGYRLAHPKPGHEVVISGLSGTFPKSANVEEFRTNLSNKVNMVAKKVMSSDPEVPRFYGMMPNLTKFDATFFGISPKQADILDILMRFSLEKSFEVIIDAGLSPEDIKGTRTGVFIANSFLDSNYYWTFINPSPLTLTG